MAATPSAPSRRTAPTRRPPGSWGTTQQLPSGHWRAFYRYDGRRITAPRTFESKAAAQAWLAGEHADRSRGTWRDPQTGRVTLADYARTWLDSRPDLAPRTASNYRTLLARWILPQISPRVELGAMHVADLSPAVVRAWYAAMFEASRTNAERVRASDLARRVHPARAWARQEGIEAAPTGRLSPALLEAWERAGRPVVALEALPIDPSHAVGRSSAAHAYSVLRAILNTAVQDGLLVTNPCQLAGAGVQRPRERRPASPAEVAQLAALMPADFAAAVTLAAWSSLRYGELFALARRNVDLEAQTLRVERALIAVPGQPIQYGPTKTRKSRRTVHLPAFVVAILAAHLEAHVPADPDALLFRMPDGAPITTARTSALMRRARKVIDRPDLTWHDLRHTGATLAYKTGASVPEVQARLGHTTMRAALIYAHAADDSDRVLADRLDAMFADQAVSPRPRLRAV
ncbi:tyrosine-type recombinase/integrase [Microbacterium lacus]|uniref:tyrosine-type recombinase/integrase n=1 Tax=Microbacterium lacus TaxID=415217 RepID=UPI00384B3A00